MKEIKIGKMRFCILSYNEITDLFYTIESSKIHMRKCKDGGYFDKDPKMKESAEYQYNKLCEASKILE